MRNFIENTLAMFGAAVLVLATSITPANAAEQVPFKAQYTSVISGPQGGPYTLVGEGLANP